MIRVVFLLVAVISITACAANPEPVREAPVEDLPAFSWLEGCWITEDGSYREVWHRGGEDLLFGFATESEAGKVVFFEQMRIEAKDPALYAYPRGIGPTRFAMRSVDEQAIEFANPENDYPQLIIYSRVEDRLTALISSGWAEQGAVWNFTPCPEDPR